MCVCACVDHYLFPLIYIVVKRGSHDNSRRTYDDQSFTGDGKEARTGYNTSQAITLISCGLSRDKVFSTGLFTLKFVNCMCVCEYCGFNYTCISMYAYVSILNLMYV